MRKCWRPASLVLVVLAMTIPVETSWGGLVSVTRPVRIHSDFVLTAVADSLWGVPAGTPVDFVAKGDLTFVVDDAGGSAANIVNVTGKIGVVKGIFGPLWDTQFYITPSRVQNGVLSNITRDNGVIVGGDVDHLEMAWEHRYKSNDSLTAYDTDNGFPLEFDGTFGRRGDSVNDTRPYEVHYSMTGDFLATDPILAVGSGMTITTVPEPATLVMSLVAVGCVVLARRWRAIAP